MQVTWKKTRVAIGEDFGPYEAEVMEGQRWNGWMIPRFTREVVEQMAKDSTELRKVDGDGYAEIRFDGDDVLVIDYPGTPEEWVERITPDAEGRYSVGAYGWTWENLDA